MESIENFRNSPQYAIVGNFVHATDASPMEILYGYCLIVQDGKICHFQQHSNKTEEILTNLNIEQRHTYQLAEWQFICPGFIDTHIHASQYPNCGKGYDKGLLRWLHNYTFPLEAKYDDVEFAKDVYARVIDRVIRNGTTTACYFATISTPATLELCDVIGRRGQRALVGKVNMNQNSPDFYCEETESSVKETIRFVEEVQSRKLPLVKPCITPRFAISCSMPLMKKLANIAHQHDLHIQTHISETRDECAFVDELFPDCEGYLDVYEQAGLLTPKTVLAHGIYLSDEERQTVKQKGCGISHCPNSNLSIRSGFLDVRKVMHSEINIGLGTDASGGYSPSILDSMRQAIGVSNSLNIISQHDYLPLDYKDVFSMATLGGSKVLAMEHEIGNFKRGKCFDALLIDYKVPDSNLEVFDFDSMEDIMQKFVCLDVPFNTWSMGRPVYVKGVSLIKDRNMRILSVSTQPANGHSHEYLRILRNFFCDDRNIKKVFVNGKMIHSL